MACVIDLFHDLHVFGRDADETKEWIDEKSQALDTDNLGSDLPTVQVLVLSVMRALSKVCHILFFLPRLCKESMMLLRETWLH